MFRTSELPSKFSFSSWLPSLKNSNPKLFSSLRSWILSWNKSILLLLLSLAMVTSCCYLDSLCLLQFLAPSISWHLKSWLSNDADDLGVWVLWLFKKKYFPKYQLHHTYLKQEIIIMRKKRDVFHVTFSFLWRMLRHFIVPLVRRY